MAHAILRQDRGHDFTGHVHRPGDVHFCEICNTLVPSGFHVCYDCDTEYDLHEWRAEASPRSKRHRGRRRGRSAQGDAARRGERPSIQYAHANERIAGHP